MDFFEWLTTKATVVRHVIYKGGNDRKLPVTQVLVDKEKDLPDFGAPKVPKPKRDDKRWYWYSKEDRARINKQRRDRREKQKAEYQKLLERLQNVKQQETHHGNN